jgi:hypothetical protein
VREVLKAFIFYFSRQTWRFSFLSVLMCWALALHNRLTSASTIIANSEVRMTLETLIAAGVFGWLLIGMVMMGLGIW